MTLVIAEQFILNYTLTEESLNDLNRTVKSYVGHLCDREVVDYLSRQLDSIGEEYTSFKSQADAMDDLDPEHPDAVGREFILQNYERSIKQWRKVRVLLGRLKVSAPSESSLRINEMAAKQLELQIPPQERAEALLKNLTKLRHNIDSGLVDNYKMLHLDEEETLISLYGNQLKELTPIGNKTEKGQLLGTLKQAAQILEKIQNWYEKESSQPAKDEDVKSTEKKSKEPTAKIKLTQEKQALLKAAPASKEAPTIKLLSQLYRHIKKHDSENTMVALAKLGSFNQKSLSLLFRHFHKIHRRKKLIKSAHPNYGRLVFTGTDRTLCKSTVNLDKHRLEAIKETIRELRKARKSSV